MSALHRDEQGAAMVEFALVFPIQLLLSLSILQFAFLAHAHLVVQQAAFMGARAGAVADVSMTSTPADQNAYLADWNAAGKQAAERVAARTLGVLASGTAPPAGATPPANMQDLSWSSAAEKRGFTGVRLQEAWSHMSLEFAAYPADCYVACEVTYDYVMMIPVANQIFAWTQDRLGNYKRLAGGGTPIQERQLTVYRISRTSFIPTPWTSAPR